mgnify:CR=1 FL=1
MPKLVKSLPDFIPEAKINKLMEEPMRNLLTNKLDGATRKFLLEHGNPNTWQGDLTSIVVQYGIPSTVALKLLGNVNKIKNVRNLSNYIDKSIGKIKNKYIFKNHLYHPKNYLNLLKELVMIRFLEKLLKMFLKLCGKEMEESTTLFKTKA